MANLEDLVEKTACFPAFEGIAWTTAVNEFRKHKMIDECPYNRAMGDLFTKICAPGANNSLKVDSLCNGNVYHGEKGALRCLVDGVADVAFLDLNSIKNFTGKYYFTVL